jgi:molecular chaperone GrpE
MSERVNGSPAPDPSADGEEARADRREAQADRPDDRAPARRTRAEERIASLGAAPSLEAELERLKDELAAAQRDAEDARASWQRSAADLANFRRRAEQERAERLGLASDMLLLKVLAVADDLDLAIEHVPDDARGSPWVEGIAAIDRKLRQLLESEGVTAMRTEGQPFDPHEHQAVSYEDSADVPDGTVLRELQRGYRVRDRVLRPALVAVARNDQAP